MQSIRELLFSVGNGEILWLRAFKEQQPVIADQNPGSVSTWDGDGCHGNAHCWTKQNNARGVGGGKLGNPSDNRMREPLRLTRSQLPVDPSEISASPIRRIVSSHLRGTRRSPRLIGSGECERWGRSAAPGGRRAGLIRNANKHIDHFNYLHCPSGWSWDSPAAGLAEQRKTAVHWQSRPCPLLWRSGSPVVQETRGQVYFLKTTPPSLHPPLIRGRTRGRFRRDLSHWPKANRSCTMFPSTPPDREWLVGALGFQSIWHLAGI